MKTHTDHQIIKHGGEPMFVIVPYNEYLDLIREHDDEITIPHEVVEATILDGKSLICAWREYKKMSQAEVAQKMGISQPAYSQMERTDAKLRRKTIEKIAAAMGVTPEQLIEE